MTGQKNKRNIVRREIEGYTEHMLANIFLILGVALVIALVTFHGFVKNAGQGFSADPASSSYQGQAIREEASQKAEDTADRNRRLIDNLKDRMNRNK